MDRETALASQFDALKFQIFQYGIQNKISLV